MQDMISYCNAHPEKRFFIDASSLIYYRGSAFETEIYGRRNGVITGCWYSGAPGLCQYTKEYFADCSAIYLIASADMEMQYGRVLDYLEERIGADAQLEDTFVASNGGEYLIFGFQKSEKNVQVLTVDFLFSNEEKKSIIMNHERRKK